MHTAPKTILSTIEAEVLLFEEKNWKLMLCKEREEVVGDWASGLLMSKGWERRTAWMGGAFLSLIINSIWCLSLSLCPCWSAYYVCVVSFVLTIGGWKLTGLASPKQRGDGELVLSFSQCPGKKLDTSLSCPTIRVSTSFFVIWKNSTKRKHTNQIF